MATEPTDERLREIWGMTPDVWDEMPEETQQAFMAQLRTPRSLAIAKMDPRFHTTEDDDG